MLDKFIYWIYNTFYSDKIYMTYFSSKKYEKGDVTSNHEIVISDGEWIEEDVWYEVIDSRYHISKIQVIETIILSTLVLLFVGFLIYIL